MKIFQPLPGVHCAVLDGKHMMDADEDIFQPLPGVHCAVLDGKHMRMGFC